MEFDPSATAVAGGIFGLPYTREESQLILLPVPWEVTTSYRGGTAHGPSAILEESVQVDLFDLETGSVYEKGIFMEPVSEKILAQNDALKMKAHQIKECLAKQGALTSGLLHEQSLINQACQKLNHDICQKAEALLAQGKIVGVVGGDHSSPLGLIEALAKKYAGQFGILHIDAHADLRESYQGFQFSHASIMRNVMSLQVPPARLVQVGIRDFCDEEFQFIKQHQIHTFFDWHLKEQLFSGTSWKDIVHQIVTQLPERVYISFDIDGLDPAFCPNTGTPVPGGLSFDQAVYLIAEIRRSGKSIIGFDLNEVSAGPKGQEQWDAVVGARMLYKLCCWTLAEIPRR